MPPVCRLLPSANAVGPDLMAADEAILHTALRTGQATLRFYEWAEPTISLGYFQGHAERLEHPLLKSLPYVRRHTGGAAIIHHRELTYALALPSGSPWHTSESWLCRFHHVIQLALKNWSVSTVKPVVCGEERKLGPFLCFLHQTPGDLVTHGAKVVGSAQRRPHGAMLQHGSILLAQSEHTPELPGLRELTGVDLSPAELAPALIEALAVETGWRFEPGELTGEELADFAKIRETKYAAPEWNDKR
jgi:lipoyl(octanoyl) transferase